MVKKITDKTLEDMGLDVTWCRARQRIGEETQALIIEAHKIEDAAERRAAIAAIHEQHRARLSALNPS